MFSNGFVLYILEHVQGADSSLAFVQHCALAISLAFLAHRQTRTGTGCKFRLLHLQVGEPDFLAVLFSVAPLQFLLHSFAQGRMEQAQAANFV